VGQLACRVVRADQPNFFDSTGCSLSGRRVPFHAVAGKEQGQYDRAEEVLAPHGCACALRKVMLDRIGGFDEDFSATSKPRISACGDNSQMENAGSAVQRWSATRSCDGRQNPSQGYHVERNVIIASGMDARAFSCSSAALHAEPLTP